MTPGVQLLTVRSVRSDPDGYAGFPGLTIAPKLPLFTGTEVLAAELNRDENYLPTLAAAALAPVLSVLNSRAPGTGQDESGRRLGERLPGEDRPEQNTEHECQQGADHAGHAAAQHATLV